MKYVTLVNSLSKFLSFLPMFIFIKSSNDLFYAPLFYGVGFFLSGLLSLWLSILYI